MVLASRQRALEARRRAAEIDPMDEAQIGELVEDAIDARNPDLAPVRAEAVEHLLGGEAAVVLAEMGDDRLARRARPRPGAAQLGARVLLPALRCGHALMVAALI